MIRKADMFAKVEEYVKALGVGALPWTKEQIINFRKNSSKGIGRGCHPGAVTAPLPVIDCDPDSESDTRMASKPRLRTRAVVLSDDETAPTNASLSLGESVPVSLESSDSSQTPRRRLLPNRRAKDRGNRTDYLYVATGHVAHYQRKKRSFARLTSSLNLVETVVPPPTPELIATFVGRKKRRNEMQPYDQSNPSLSSLTFSATDCDP